MLLQWSNKKLPTHLCHCEKSTKSTRFRHGESFNKQAVIIPTNCKAVFMVMARFVLLSVHPLRLCSLFAFVGLTSISLLSLIYPVLFMIMVKGLCSFLYLHILIFLFSHFGHFWCHFLTGWPIKPVSTLMSAILLRPRSNLVGMYLCTSSLPSSFSGDEAHWISAQPDDSWFWSLWPVSALTS